MRQTSKDVAIIIASVFYLAPQFIFVAASWLQYGTPTPTVSLFWKIVTIIGTFTSFLLFGAALNEVFSLPKRSQKIGWSIFALLGIALMVHLYGFIGVGIYAHNAHVVPYIIMAASFLIGFFVIYPLSKK